MEKHDLLEKEIENLPTSEKNRSFDFRQEKSRLCYVVSRALLRKLLSNYLNRSADSITFERGPHGKPYIKNSPLQFNLSHSADFVAIAFCIDSPVGIDIEKVRQNIRIDNLVKRFFHPEEIHNFFSMTTEQKTDFLFRRWTIREAFLKGIGTGLTVSPQSFCVIPCPEDIETFYIKPDPSLKQKSQEDYSSWRISCVPAPENYYCSIAYRNQ